MSSDPVAIIPSTGLPDKVVERLVLAFALASAAVILVNAVYIMANPRAGYSWIAPGFSLLACAVVLALVYVGQWRLGRWLVAAGSWLIVFVLVCQNGGNQAVNTGSWFPVMMITAALFGSRGALMAIGLQWVMSALVYALTVGGWLVPLVELPAGFFMAEVVSTCVMTAVVMTVTLHALEQQLVRAQASHADAEEREELALARIANFHLIARVIPGVVLVADESNAQLTYVSPGFKALTGHPASEAVREPNVLLEALSSDSRGRVDLARPASWPQLLTFEHPEGPRLVEVLSSSLINRSRRVVVLRDVTKAHADAAADDEERDMLDRVQQMEALGRLSGAVAHDFRNLLSAMRGLTVMVERDLSDLHPARRDLSEVAEAVNRASELTAELLAISRAPETDEYSIHLGRHLRRTLWMLRRLLRANIELVEEDLEGAVQVALPSRIFESFLFGAVLGLQEQFDARGRIEVSSTVLNSRVCIRVTGGPLDEIEDQWVTTLGSGLPLSCTVGSHLQGETAVYELHIPVVDGSPMQLGQVVVHETHANLGRALGRMLSRMGFQVHQAKDIQHACELATTYSCEFAMIHGDRNPDMAVLLRDQLDRAAPGIEVIWTMPQGRRLAGACLQKPYGPESLGALLSERGWKP